MSFDFKKLQKKVHEEMFEELFSNFMKPPPLGQYRNPRYCSNSNGVKFYAHAEFKKHLYECVECKMSAEGAPPSQPKVSYGND